MLSAVLVLVILLALCFDFINGFHDTANSIATSVSTRVLSPFQAICMAAVLNFAGAMVSVTVATTIAKGLVNGAPPQYILIAAITAAIIWDLITWYYGIPSSSSHALIGGLVGAALMHAANIRVIQWGGVWNKVILPLLSSPIIGFALGFILMKLLFILLRPFSQRQVNKWFSKLQILSAAFMAFEHGRNDAQKSMGIITLALISGGIIQADAGIPWEVKVACAIAMALGTSVGGWRIIKTMGVNMIRLQPINGFAAETAAALVISTASAAGAPVSTTHVISSAIMGVGASKRLSAVRWALAKNIVWAWILTIPLSAILGAVMSFIFRFIFH